LDFHRREFNPTKAIDVPRADARKHDFGQWPNGKCCGFDASPIGQLGTARRPACRHRPTCDGVTCRWWVDRRVRKVPADPMSFSWAFSLFRRRRWRWRRTGFHSNAPHEHLERTDHDPDGTPRSVPPASGVGWWLVRRSLRPPGLEKRFRWWCGRNDSETIRCRRGSTK
jgi:hypothetical protein